MKRKDFLSHLSNKREKGVKNVKNEQWLIAFANKKNDQERSLLVIWISLHSCAFLTPCASHFSFQNVRKRFLNYSYTAHISQLNSFHFRRKIKWLIVLMINLSFSSLPLWGIFFIRSISISNCIIVRIFEMPIKVLNSLVTNTQQRDVVMYQTEMMTEDYSNHLNDSIKNQQDCACNL